MRKYFCWLLNHKFVTRLIEGKREVRIGELTHEYTTLVDVKLVCKHCGHVEDRETLVKK